MRIAYAGIPTVALLIGSASPVFADPPTDYEGFGAITQGAESSPEGHTLYHVTSLADNGAGTLRDAVSQNSRYIVFDVGGTINLSNHLFIETSYLTIDGASAPSPGITISMSDTTNFSLEADDDVGPVHDVIIHHLRIDGNADGEHTNQGDILGLDGQATGVHDVILDHITGHAAGDGIFDLWYDVHDVTISWCLITDTIAATHSSGSVSSPRYNLSFHHNIWANNSDRMPRIRRNTQTLDLVNNVIYQWEVYESSNGATAIVDDPGEPDHSVNIISNYYYPGVGDPDEAIVYGTGPNEGPDDDGGPPEQPQQGDVWEGSQMGELFVIGNILPPENYDHWSTRSEPLPIPAYAQVTTYAADSLADTVVPFVGTHFPTAEEQALINEIISNLGGGSPGEPGDLNCDGAVNDLDVPYMVQALLDPAAFTGCDINRADMNDDGDADGADLQAFIDALLA